MNKCLEDCNIKDKLSECCGKHPETLRFRLTLIEDKILKACPSFSGDGICLDYKNRPETCSEYKCQALKNNETI